MSRARFGRRPLHLAKRLAGSLSRADIGARDQEWVRRALAPGELALWLRMSPPDRRHAVAVARRADAALGGAPREVVSAALLHDVGKAEAGLGTAGRVAATLLGEAGGRRYALRWSDLAGSRGRAGRYLSHPAVGASLLEELGSDGLVVCWAREHHLPLDRVSIPAAAAAALRDADDD